MKKDYEEWETQLNAYDYMLWKDGIDINSIKVFMVVSDWSKGETFKQDYPDTNINIITLDRWTRARQQDWITTKVELWKSTRSLSDTDLPLCTATERWASAPVYKLYRTPKLQRANKTFPIKSRAEAYMNACKKKDPTKWGKALIRVEQGEQWRRCNWCDAAEFCNQFQNKITS